MEALKLIFGTYQRELVALVLTLPRLYAFLPPRSCSARRPSRALRAAEPS
jgi:hypothetical protein